MIPLANLFCKCYAPEILLLLLMLVSVAAILLFLHYFGAAGIYSYIVVAVPVSNIQVLKACDVVWMAEPIALGSIVFTSIFLCTDILNEYYGKKYAQKAVFLSFATIILHSIFMVITISIKPHHDYVVEHQAMHALFAPAPAIIISSIIAYIASQIYNIWLFRLIKRLTHDNFLWLRTFLSIALAILLDNFLFSWLAWQVFNSHPVGWYTLFTTYVFGTYGVRIFFIVFSIPVMYLVKKVIYRPPVNPPVLDNNS